MRELKQWRRKGVASVGRPAIVLTAGDHAHLVTLLQGPSAKDSRAAQFLQEEIDRAIMIAADVTPSSLVKMGCEVKFLDHMRARVRVVKLVYPDEATNDRCVSILSALGGALIGLGPGQSISWVNDGKERKVTVLEVHPSR